jgi:hypothetical protein
MEFNRNFRSLMDISGNLATVELSGIPRLVKSSRFFRCKVDISGNLRLINLSGFLRFWFGVKAVYYRAFLLAIGGGK